MKILFVAATWMEIKMIADELGRMEEKGHLLRQYRLGEIEVDVLLTGIGTTFTTFNLTQVLLQNKYQSVINIGIAGSLNHDLAIGEVVSVVSEQFADLGIEKQDEFLTLFESGFMEANEFPFENASLKATDCAAFSELKKVKGITTNKSHGRKSSIAEIRSKFPAQTESMEGAAVFYVCACLGVPCCQVRAVSNYVEQRDSAQWNIPLALENLKETVLNVLKKLAMPVY